MKAILTVYGALMLSITAYAQQPDKALVKVQYNFIHVSDTANRSKPYTENMLLVAGKNASYYSSYDVIEGGVGLQLQMQELLKQGLTQQEINQQRAPSKKYLTTQYYYFFRENKFYSKETICVNGCMVEDIIEKPDWKITKDTLSFSGIRAQKATARFKGRNWTAWFAPELPFESGPWKLNGLPGLILEAYDDKKDVQFKFLGVENIKEGDLATENAYKLSPDNLRNTKGMFPALELNQVALPPQKEQKRGGYQSMTKKEYDKLKEAYDNDPNRFTRAQFAGMGVPGDIVNTMMSGGPGGGSVGGNGAAPIQQAVKRAAPVKDPINNPIELPQKK